MALAAAEQRRVHQIQVPFRSENGPLNHEIAYAQFFTMERDLHWGYSCGGARRPVAGAAGDHWVDGMLNEPALKRVREAILVGIVFGRVVVSGWVL